MTFGEDILDEFKRLTRKDIRDFLKKSADFFTGDYNLIVQYFSGDVKDVTSTPFMNFELLKEQKNIMFEAFHRHSRSMKDSRWWDLLEMLEEIDSRLSTLDNINRWSRSSVTSTSYSPNVQLQHTLGQNETLERVAREVLGSSDPEDSWVDIAISNDLEEEDYTPAGGNDLRLEIGRSINLGIQLNSVVDFLDGKTVYGKDIYRRLQFVQDIDGNDDLQVLGYDDTMLQSVDILAGLNKNDNPDYPQLGLQKTIAVGSTRAMMNFPVIVRQMKETFASDDSLKEFNVNLISIDQDNLSLDYQVKTRLNEIESGKVLL